MTLPGTLINLMSKSIRSGRLYLRRFGGPVYLALAIAAIIFALFVDRQQLLKYTFQLDPFRVLLSTAVAIAGIVGLAVPAWHWVLSRLGSRLSYRDNLQIYCYSILGVAIPGGFWPLVGRIAFYERHDVTGKRVTVATAVELLLTGLAGLVVYGVTLWFQPVPGTWQIPELTVVVILMVTLIVIQPPIFNRVLNLLLRDSNKDNGKKPVIFSYGDLAAILGLEAMTTVVGGTAIYIFLQSFVVLSAQHSLYVVVVGAWAASVAAGNLFFWIPGKQVLGSGAMVLALTPVLSTSLALILVVLIRVWSIVVLLIAAGLIWLLNKDGLRLRPANKRPPQLYTKPEDPTTEKSLENYQ